MTALKPFRRLAPDARPDVDAATGLATFVFNDESIGRDGHIVRNAGIRTANFLRNPVILFGHLDEEPAIGRAVDINVASPASRVTIEFTPEDLNPFGAMIGRLVKARFLNAVSESWQPIKVKRLPSGDGYDFIEVDLLEISIVNVPALASAIATARSRGIDTTPMLKWSERHLDSRDRAGVDRGQLLALRRAASGGFTAYSQHSDLGRPERLARARQLAEIGARQDRALQIGARSTSKLPSASREALEQVQGHHASCKRLAGELQRRHTRMADDVGSLPGIHRALTRAITAAGVKDDYGIRKGLSDLQRCATDIDTNHDGATTATEDLGVALGAAKAGVQDVVDGISELDEA